MSEQQPQTEWTDLRALSELPPQGQGKYIACKKQSLAVFRQGEDVRVIGDTCPHAGGSLAGGFIRDGVVHCPWHGWPFRLADGKCPHNEAINVPTYEARIADGKVQAKVPALTPARRRSLQ